MRIGSPYWVPSHLDFVEDDDFWTGADPVEPAAPETGGTTTDGDGGAGNSDAGSTAGSTTAYSGNGLAQTSDPTNVVGTVVCVVVAAAAIGIAVALRRRSR